MNLSIVSSLFSQGAVLASAGNGDWGDGSGGWWIVRLAFLIFWVVAVLFLLRWFAFGRWGRRGWGPSGIDRARGILAERYARGEIDAEEYRERSEQLK